MKQKYYLVKTGKSRLVMRHIRAFSLIISIFLIVSGCSNSNLITENNAPESIGGYNEFNDIGRINEIKNGLTPNIKTNKPYKPMNDNKNQEQETSQAGSAQEEQTQLEELTKLYDSALIKTNFGDIKVKFYGADSPLTVNNFMNLAKSGFYNGIKFHRVIDNFMIQGGDPNSKSDDWSTHGTGGPGYKFQDEFNDHKLVRGSFAMANSGPNTNGSQFFIVTADSTPWLDGKHTNFGEVIEGMDTVLKIESVPKNENDHPTEDVIIESIELLSSSESAPHEQIGAEMSPEENMDISPENKSVATTTNEDVDN